jgi:GNAT superfamily N-acetyltransferase
VAHGIDIRPGNLDDVPAVLGLLDEAVAWLVALGRTGQWGNDPASLDPQRHEMVRAWVDEGGLYLAEIEGAPVGALAIGSAPAYVPSITGSELYIGLLVTARARKGLRIGARLLDHASEVAAGRDKTLLRVDCYSGDDRALVRYYESQGFVATDPFTIELPEGPWPGQVLEQRLS